MADPLGRVERADIVRYSGASGDDNPLHYDDSFARAAGYDGIITMGALPGGWLVSHAFAHGARIAERGPSRLRLRYQGIVPPGLPLEAELDQHDGLLRDTLTGGGERKATLEIRALDTPPARGSGRRVETTTFPIELGAARRFAHAVRWPHRIEPGSPVPPTFLSVLFLWTPSSDPIQRVGFDPTRTLHGETVIDQVDQPLRVGEQFQVREYVGDVRVRSGGSGELRLVDLIAELSDYSGELRAVYRNTFVLTSPPPRSAPPAPTLHGSRDPATDELYCPPRALSVDGRLRTLVETELPDTGVLYSWTSFAGQVYGQVDLPGGVRIQGRLAPGTHEIGADYALAAAPDEDWWFARV